MCGPLAKCPFAKCPLTKCPLAKCPLTKCPDAGVNDEMDNITSTWRMPQSTYFVFLTDVIKIMYLIMGI